MKRPLQLSLAIALALAGTNALALGLGPVRVMSKLNQPLQAEIPVIQGGAGEAEGLLVNLADQEDFEKLGISRSNLGVPLEFSVAKDAHGQTVIRVTSKEPVRSTYLDFLIEANWPKGRMLREYTVLLDPPVTAPAATAPAATAVAAAPAVSEPAKPAASHPAKPVAEPAAPVEKKPVAHAAPAPTPAPARKVVEGEYGPTKAGETLSAIAHETRQGGADVNQMMLALLKSNPDAFYRNNINALKRGVILRVPSADEIKAIGSASEAAQQVQAQVEDWRGGRAATTRVASEGDKPAPAAAKPAKSAAPAVAAAGSKKGDERLELVPPKAGKDSLAMADRPGASGAGSSSASTEAARELARTKEALAASDQATGELKSRVKDLEDLKSKNERLISLKDSEIADLQQKLKELQAAKAATPAPVKAAGEAATAAAADKKDIWGDNAKTSATAKADAKPAEMKPADAKPVDAKAADAKAAAPAAAVPTDQATTPPPTAAKPVDTADKAIATTPLASTTPAPATPSTATTTPSSTASAPTAPAPTPAETKPLADHATTPPATPTPAKPAPAKPATPPKALAQPAWYEADWVKPAAIGGAVLLALLAFLGMRKRKTAAVVATGAAATSSIADSFGDSPFGANADARSAIETDIENLQDKLAAEPHNLGAHLELLSIFYAERDVPRFEEAAEHMHQFVADPHQPEWAEVQAMGEELAPHHPLWAQPAHEVVEAESHYGAPHVDTAAGTFMHDDHVVPAHEEHFTAPAESFGFGAGSAHAASAQASSEDAFGGFDSIPPLGDTQMIAEPEPVAAPSPVAAPAPSEDFFADEDAVGTKLDLAKAYLDMGDPDGARSMLEEVVAEGSDAQRAEANRLIAELR